MDFNTYNGNKNFISFVKNISFLKKLSERCLEELLAQSNIKNIKKEETIFLEGEHAAHFYILLNGSLKLYSETVNGYESVTRLLSNGDFFGERSLSDNPIYSNSAEATRNSQLLEIPAELLKSKIMNDQRTGAVFFQEILNVQSRLEEQIEHLTVMNASQRIGWYLINAGSKVKDLTFSINLQHEKSLIATFLGMKPETFSRAIKKLKKADVHVNGMEILIKNRSLLEKYCSEKLSIDDGKATLEKKNNYLM